MKNIHLPLYAWDALTICRGEVPTYVDGVCTNRPSYYVESDGPTNLLVLTACGKIVPYQQTLLNRELGLSKTTCERCDTNAH